MSDNKCCIIMADGQAKRMSGLNKKKQLIKVNGVPIIERTIKQLRDRGIEPVLATHYKEFDYLDVEKIIPKDNSHEITKFYSNHEYYDNFYETLFLWGDTCFDDKDLDEILNTGADDFLFFGTKYEIFGFKIRRPYYWQIKRATEHIQSHEKLDYGNTGSWGMLRHMGGFELLPNPLGSVGGVTSVHEPDKYIKDGLLHLLTGKSIDCDGIRDIPHLAEQFGDVERLTYTDDNGEKYVFEGKEWVKDVSGKHNDILGDSDD